MKLDRKFIICVAAVAGIGLGASVAHAQTVCRHFGQWTRVDGHFVCKGDYASAHCIWTDDCRVSVE